MRELLCRFAPRDDCANKSYGRQRTCCGNDPMACRQRLWRLKKARPKTLWNEWARIDSLSKLPYRPRADRGTGVGRKG